MSEVSIRINDREVTTESGKTLLQAVMDVGIPIDTACGGQARCHLCRVTITEGREHLSKANPVEYKALGNVLIAQGMRLGCQVEVTQPMTVTVPEPRPKRRHVPSPRPPKKTEGSNRNDGQRGEADERRRPAREGKPAENRDHKPAEPQRSRDEQPRGAVSSEEPRKKKRRRRRPRRRRNKSEGS